jgi:hypothetical protein
LNDAMSKLSWQQVVLPRSGRIAAAVSVVILSAATLLPAVSLEGTVRNGTTSQPVSGIAVQFIQLQQGMTPVASATTDPRGVFRFDGVEAFTGSPAMLQVEYAGATYSQPLISPQTMASGIQFLVYDASNDPSIISLAEHAIFLRPAGGELMVIEQIAIVNNSSPPRTYANPEGTYRFTLPGTPRGGWQASIEGAAGMPIQQSPEPLETANSFAITYPIRPGESNVRLQYLLDYQSPMRLRKPLLQTAQQTHIVTPGIGVEVSGENLAAVGREPTTGFAAFQVSPGINLVDLEISGEAPATQAEALTAEPQQSTGLVPIPDAATDRRWLILSALGLILLAGLVYLYRE